MRLAVLTTDTLHHAYFLREIQERYEVGLVLSEQVCATAPFDVAHDFESARDEHERERFFGGKHASIKDFGKVLDVDSVNSPGAVAAMKEFAPDVMLVFGTGIIRQEAIELCPDGLINLHGGDPERYRGLDSHLWSIYHNDFSGLVSTIHRVNPTLDDGEIILQEQLKFEPGAQLDQLRAVNTEACVRISLGALDMYARDGVISSRPQQKDGRYYSFMPACMKDLCVAKFAKFTGGAA